MQQIEIDAALLGVFVSMLIQAIKLLPAKYLSIIFTNDEKKQKLRMRAVVFMTTVLFVFADVVHNGLLLNGSGLYNSMYMVVIALTSSYITYQTVIKMLQEQFPEYFTLSEKTDTI